MSKKKTIIYSERKLFVNNLNSWFSNFIIEEFRTDYLPDSKLKTIIMGTMDPFGGPLPKLFEPKETFIEVGYNYSQEIFQNDIFIFNLDDSNLPEVEFVVRGLQNISLDAEKILIIVSNMMTWGETPVKTFTEEETKKEGFNEEEVPEIIDEEEKENNNKENNEKEEEKKRNEIEAKKENEKIAKEKDESNNDKDKLKKKDTKTSIKKDTETNKESNNDLNKENKTEKEIKNEEDKNITDNQKDQKEQQPNEDQNFIEEMEEYESGPGEDESSKESEKPKIKTYYYRETEYQSRCPNSKYFYYKILETLTLSNKNPKLKAYVICPGFIYGCGEQFFFDYFRLAWMGHLPYMPIVGEGSNFLPTIHILDLVQVIKRIIEKKPEQKYFFVCDKTKNPTMKNILNCIGNSIGGVCLVVVSL